MKVFTVEGKMLNISISGPSTSTSTMNQAIPSSYMYKMIARDENDVTYSRPKTNEDGRRPHVHDDSVPMVIPPCACCC